MSKVCVVGHVTCETIVVNDQRSPPTVGGTGFFSSLTYQELGLKTILVTKVARTDQKNLLSSLEHAGITIHCLKSARTLRFENIYSSINSNNIFSAFP